MKKLMSGETSITIQVLLTIISGIAIGIFTAISYVNSQISPVAAETQANSQAIAGMQSDISWVKQALQAQGFSPKGQQIN
jgi:uncharacterized protein YneF (UPF0154 family)